jgi:hypothetical protein
VPSGFEQNENRIDALNNTMPVGVIDRFTDGSPASGYGSLGLFTLHLDTSTISAELIPLRSSASTDTLEVVDITNFLSMAPCSDCAKIKSVSVDADGNLVVSIGLKHPFDVGDPLLPISGKNRADLHVFNVEGIVVSNAVGVPYAGLGDTIADFNLISADGYTGYLDGPLDDNYLTDATIHPYVLHFDDYSSGNFASGNPMGFESVTDPPPSGNLVMAMGCDYDYQDYVFSLSGELDFIYAIGCTYAVSSDNKKLRFTPEYRIPQHSKKAASEVWVEIVSNDLAGEDAGSSAELAVKVLDMNHGVAVGSNLDEMFADSSVGQISVEIPGVTSSPVVVPSPVPTGGNGRDPADPLSFSVTVTNSASGIEGTYQGLVKVSDSYMPGQNTSPLLSGMDGITRVEPVENPLSGLFDIDEFANWAVFSIDVEVGEYLTACFTADPDEVRMEIDPTIDFDGSCSNDPNGYNIVSFEWDFDWDGDPANFVADDTTAIPTTSNTFSAPGTFTVALRITNDAPVPHTSEIFSDDVIVHGWIKPGIRLTPSDVTSTDMWWCVDTRIATTSDGLIHIVADNYYGTATPTYSRYEYYKCDSSGNILFETIIHDGSMESPGVITIGMDVYVFYVAWSQGILYRRDTGSGFEPAVFAFNSDSGKWKDNASYAVNPDGDVLVMMSAYGSYPDSAYVSYAIDVGGAGSFTPKTVIGTPDRWLNASGQGYGITVSAVADSTGDFHLSWDGLPMIHTSNRDIWYVTYDGAISATSEIADTGTQEYFPLLRVDGDDNVYCGYRTYSQNYMAIKPAANTEFDPPFLVANARQLSYDIHPVSGDVMYAYQEQVPVRLWSKIFNTSDTPTDMLNAFAFRVDDTVDSDDQRWPNLTHSPDGHWYMLWEDYRDGNRAMFFEMYY